jgi:4-amino-4-deoxy-L-arabinose transferase-like glycosyltransferase
MRQVPRDIPLAGGLFLGAILLRLPNLMTVPFFTDEIGFIRAAMALLEQHQWRLVAVNGYEGPLFTDTLAFVLWLFGYHLYIPRALVLFLGGLTVVAVYFLGKEWAHGDRRVGLLAACFLAVNSYHIVFNSHIAWSNETTPLFIVLTLLAYTRATHPRRARWLIVAGFLYGLAVQSHPSALALAPALILDFLLSA